MMGRDAIKENYSNFFRVDRYTLDLRTVVTHWVGDDSGKMTGMPGDFLSSELSLKDIQNPDTLEKLALEKKVEKLQTFTGDRMEITSQPKGYTKLVHDHRLFNLKKRDPNLYYEDIRRALKERL